MKYSCIGLRLLTVSYCLGQVQLAWGFIPRLHSHLQPLHPLISQVSPCIACLERDISVSQTSRTGITGLAALPPAMLDSASTTVESIMSSTIFQYFVQKLIDVSLPAVVTLMVVFFSLGQIRSTRKDVEQENEAMETTNAIAELYNDLYGTTENGGIMKSRRGGNNLFFGGGGGGGFNNNRSPLLPKNLGLPQKEYIRIINRNEKLDAYDFSMIKSTQSKAKAAAQFRAKSFERALGLAMNADNSDGETSVLTVSTVRAKLLQAEKKFLKQGKELLTELQAAEAKLAQLTIDEGLEKVLKEETETKKQDNEVDNSVVDVQVLDKQVDTNVTTVAAAAATTTTGHTAVSYGKQMTELTKKTLELQAKLKTLELQFLQEVVVAIGSKRGIGLRNAVLGDIQVRGAGGLLRQLQERPLSSMLQNVNSKSTGEDSGDSRTKSLFVMNFPGDVQASQLNELREEVTAVVRNAQPGDEALVVLQSGGGTVTGYGLAAGQLVRLKEKGLKLTIAVEQVAASGGYMMSCVADKIVASPFAVLGSIGVISEIPNVYERLKEEGMYVLQNEFAETSIVLIFACPHPSTFHSFFIVLYLLTMSYI
jgi:hypothetical protein